MSTLSKPKTLTHAQIIDAEPTTLEQPNVMGLSVRFVELRRQLVRDMVEITIEVGQILSKARPLRQHLARDLDDLIRVAKKRRREL